MFVLCPHCQFLVALDPASGEPPSRCPRCEALLAPPTATLAAAATAPTPAPPAEPTRAPDDPLQAPAFDEQVAASPEAASGDSEHADMGAAAPAQRPASAHARKRAPSFVRVPADRAPAQSTRWRQVATILGLLALLLLQSVLADRARLAADARWRTPISVLCRVLRCALPAWREPAAFTLLDRDVRPNPNVPGALRVTASFRNDARWPQPWPALLLTLSDVDGRVVGARVFAPRDYLGAATTQDGLSSGQRASVVMDVREPEPGVVAFNFDFR